MDERKTALIFKAFCDENRIRIIKLLRSGEKCACKLLEEINVTQPTLSHHLKILCDCGIVVAEKDWKWTYYSINCDKLNELLAYLGNTKCNGRATCECKKNNCN